MINVGKPRLSKMRIKPNLFKVAGFTPSQIFTFFLQPFHVVDVIGSSFLVAFGTELRYVDDPRVPAPTVVKSIVTAVLETT